MTFSPSAAEKNAEREEKDKNDRLVERSYGSVSRASFGIDPRQDHGSHQLKPLAATAILIQVKWASLPGG